MVLGRGNPELPGIARKCAADLGDATRVLAGFGLFHGLLLGRCAPPSAGRHLLSRMTAATREGIVREVDAMGSEGLVRDAFEAMTSTNPELLQAAHDLACGHRSYAGLMRGSRCRIARRRVAVHMSYRSSAKLISRQGAARAVAAWVAGQPPRGEAKR